MNYEFVKGKLKQIKVELDQHKDRHSYFYDASWFDSSDLDMSEYLTQKIFSEVDTLAEFASEICQTVFPTSHANENIVFNFSFNTSQISKRKTDEQEWAEHIDKMKQFEIFLQKKLIKLEILMNDKQSSVEKNNIHTNIGNVNHYVAGNSINISNVTNYLNIIKEEIQNEPNLTTEEKQKLQNVIAKESSRWDKIKSEFVKHDGKFTGQILRSFSGLD